MLDRAGTCDGLGGRCRSCGAEWAAPGNSFTNVPGGTANWTFTDATGNYNNATGTAAIVISKQMRPTKRSVDICLAK